MEYLDFIEVVNYFSEDINKGFAAVNESDDERIIITEEAVFTKQIVDLNNGGYHVAVFGTEDQKVKLIISKNQL